MLRLLHSRLLLFLILPFLLAWAPHDNDRPGRYGAGGDPWPSLNADLLAHLPLNEIGGGSGVDGNDCWGWTDPLDNKEYALVGLSNKTSFVDITDPTDPKYLGYLPTQTGNAIWRDMKVYNNYMFVVSDGNSNHGMQVFDLTRLRGVDPNNPQTFNNDAWYGSVSSSHNVVINEDTGFAYIVGSNQANGGLHAVDISNPTSPTFAGNFSADGYTHDAQVVTYHGPDADYAGREIAFCANEDTVTIVDVTNKSNMTMVSRNVYAQDQYTHQGWLSEDHRYFYMGDELDESSYGGPTRTHIFDCQDLDNPNYVGFYSGVESTIDHNLYVKGDYLYQANYTSGLRVLDISNPTQPVEIAFFDTYPAGNGVSFNGAWSCYPYFDSGTILVSDIQSGLFLVRLSPLQFVYPSGRPDLVNPGGGVEFTVEVVGLFSQPQSGTGVLHVDRGSGFESFPMNEVSSNVYEANFPASNCGSELNYYVSVMTTDGETFTDPVGAPNLFYTAISADGVEITFADDFETNQGWTVSGDASTGQWERAIPNGGGERGDPPTDGDGSGRCYVTENGAGDTDIDGGSTVLTSPIMDATSETGLNAILSYDRWYSNNFGASPEEDNFVVEISNDGGASWTNLEVVGPSGPEVGGGWYHKSFVISDFVTPTDQMRVRFTASDLGNASVVEAAVDGVEISIINCDGGPICADNGTLIEGFGQQNDFSATCGSDDVRWAAHGATFVFQITEPVTEFELSATAPNSTPGMISIDVEASKESNNGNLNLRASLFNFTTEQYVSLPGVMSLSTSDAVQSFNLPAGADPVDFVDPGTNEVLLLLQTIQTSGPANLRTQFDEVLFIIN